ncbi:MAG: hypothetical protein IKE60_34770 [Reyranella sp.]|jgi:hypothetical protein|uniref:hypothetical protein n=1 Tax=Reyranella sp. TaxID=1929291 RepID=UPI0009623929|nr:hypothetical protein [Reyranella sp.]MBN9539410.1 hypothetical protein [Alphaproteobacteria bacterium]MBR2819885.1 hypothetical protein [Reyranella sp.]OJU47185.1 MAG: hypothetical protein BGN99_20920 [Alphaproteobacteria bacterium 65-37]
MLDDPREALTNVEQLRRALYLMRTTWRGYLSAKLIPDLADTIETAHKRAAADLVNTHKVVVVSHPNPAERRKHR